MTYRAYRDAGPYPSIVVQLIPCDGRDTDGDARDFFGDCIYIGEVGGSAYAQSPNNPDWRIAYLY